MYKERECRTDELEQFTTTLGEAFIQRWDLYARQLDDGSYICIRKPLQMRHLLAHLKGELTLGAYVLDQDSRVRYLIFDADDEAEMEKIANMKDDLVQAGICSYLEQSRRGGHLWLFFPNLIPGKEVRTFSRKIVKAYGLENIEFFPKQDKLTSGPGSLIRLPFGVHRKDGQRYGFINSDGTPLAHSFADQIRILSTHQTVPEDFMKSYRMVGISDPRGDNLEKLEPLSGAISQQIKEAISVLDFVGQYVDLSPSGRGLCPFHDDQHASFSVNAEGNYWYCFAGCGGGSIIDFWMKWRGCDFTEGIRELARILLT
jgi:hypothetical protein